MAGRLGEQRHVMLGSAALGITGTELEPPDAGCVGRRKRDSGKLPAGICGEVAAVATDTKDPLP
jgi:hypothetical protein